MTGCPYDPTVLAGFPIGMLHCPQCGCMVLAGLDHPPCDIDFCDYGIVIDYPTDPESLDLPAPDTMKEDPDADPAPPPPDGR